jgi:hypothetical protein
METSYSCVQRRIDAVEGILRFSGLTGGGRPQVPQVKESEVSGEIRNNSEV